MFPAVCASSRPPMCFWGSVCVCVPIVVHFVLRSYQRSNSTLKQSAAIVPLCLFTFICAHAFAILFLTKTAPKKPGAFSFPRIPTFSMRQCCNKLFRRPRFGLAPHPCGIVLFLLALATALMNAVLFVKLVVRVFAFRPKHGENNLIITKRRK